MKQTIISLLCIFSGVACFSQTESESAIRSIIEDLGRQFSEEFRNHDSLALADHYASDGMLGSVKGKENLVSAWGRMIRSGIANGTPDLIFTTQSLAADDEYIVELGGYGFVDAEGVTQNQGKYVVVWKQEDGEWKIYRDIGL